MAAGRFMNRDQHANKAGFPTGNWKSGFIFYYIKKGIPFRISSY